MKSAFIGQIVTAIETHEIKAYYQPQYDANSGRLVSAEALVRWEKSNGELVSPDQFIPQLEQTEDINFLDWFMAEEACRTIHELGSSAVPIAVNFSRWHVKEKDFHRKLDVLLHTYDIKPEYFEVEITESALAIEDFKVIEDWAYKVADLGVNIAIDDFGEGFTSLQFVKDMPVSFLKIDKAFLKDNCQDDRGRGTLEAVFYFANRLNLRTIAEGVETLEQLKFLQSMDCDRVQGFLFSKPVKKEDFIVLAMMDTSPTVDDDSYIKKKGSFSSQNLLMRAIHEEYDLIIFGNLYKNSYYVMYMAEGLHFLAPTAGVIDDMAESAMAYASKETAKLYEKQFSRKALIESYISGVHRVEMEVSENIGDSVEIFRTAIHLLKHPYKDDILMVGLSKRIEKKEA